MDTDTPTPQQFRQIWTSAFHKHPEGSAPIAGRRSVYKLSIAEVVLLQAIDEWRGRCIENFLVELDIWPASNTLPNLPAIKFFNFGDSGDNSLFTPFLSPVRFERLMNPDSRIGVSIRQNGAWVSVGEFLQSFVRPMKPSEVLKGHPKQLWAFNDSMGRKFDLAGLPREIRELIYEFLSPPELCPDHFKRCHPLFGKELYRDRYNSFKDNREATWSLFPATLPFAIEANTRFLQVTTVVFSTVGEVENFFSKHNKMPVTFINTIRTLGFDFSCAKGLFRLFGAKISPQVYHCPSFAATIVQSMKDLRKIYIRIPSGPWNEPVDFFHHSAPCRTLMVDWLLETLFSWIYHIPEVVLTGLIKTHQLERFQMLREQAQSMESGSSRPSLTEMYRKAAEKGSRFAQIPLEELSDPGVHNWSDRQLRNEKRKLCKLADDRTRASLTFAAFFISKSGDGVTREDTRCVKFPGTGNFPPPCTCLIPCNSGFWDADDDMELWEEFQRNGRW